MKSPVSCPPISRRAFVQSGAILAAVAALPRVLSARSTKGESLKADVCIYAATSGGIVAAVRLAQLGRSVVVVEPTRHIGGMTSGGLGRIDYGHATSIAGLTKLYFDEVRTHYTTADGKVEGNGLGVEPKVAEAIFERWIARHRIKVVREARLATVRKDGLRLTAITLDRAGVDARGAPVAQASEPGFLTITAGMFIDCSYEGDLMAKAGVKYRTDREGADEHAETLAGVLYNATDTNGSFGLVSSRWPSRLATRIDPYRRPGDPGSGLLPLISPGPLPRIKDRSPVVQAYNFRLCLTRDNPIEIAAPTNYDPARYELVRRYIESLEEAGDPLWVGDLYSAFGHENRHPHPRLLKNSRLVRGKTDLNNAGPVSMDYVTGGAERYAEATWAERAELWHAHEDYQRGFLYYLRTEPRLPDWLRQEISLWGLPRDEFQDTGGWPNQLYVREARRMVGAHLVTQQDCEQPVKREDSIGLASYSLDSHLCQRFAHHGMMVNEGGFYHDVKPWPIPYGVITPGAGDCENLLVTFCVSSTHVAFASFRMEPAFMILSESAAVAVDLALRGGTSVQAVNRAELVRKIRDGGQLL